MTELLTKQTCPHCGYEEDDNYAIWDESGDEVTCEECNKTYTSTPQYQFIGFQIDFECAECGEETMDGEKLCDCGEYSESY